MSLIILIILANIIVFLQFKLLMRYPVPKALFYSISVWPVAIIVIYLSRHDAGILSTRSGTLVLGAIVGLIFWYLGKRIFSEKKYENHISGSIQANDYKLSVGDHRTEIHNEESIGMEDDETEIYEFEWMFLSDIQRQQIATYVRANANDSWSKQNVNLLYGVVDQQRTFVLTLIYYLSDAIMRTDTGFNHYRFAFIINGELMTASCDMRGRIMKNYNIDRTKPYYHLVKQAIQFYNASSNSELKNQFEQQNPNTKFYNYMDILRKELLTNFIVETSHMH